MSHPTHPKCPGCGKALFKAFDGPWNGKPAVKVRPADPYRFCRNTKCSRSGPSGVSPSPEPGPAPKKQPRARTKADQKAHEALEKKYADADNHTRANMGLEPKPEPARPPRRARPVAKKLPAKPGEPEAVAKARERIRSLLKQVTAGTPPVSVGLVLAIVNQETGNHAAANALIDEFHLDKVFGLIRFSEAPTT